MALVLAAGPQYAAKFIDDELDSMESDDALDDSNNDDVMSTRSFKADFHEEKKHPAWDVKSTIAFWVSALTVEGSALFLIGSLFLYPGLLPEGEDFEYAFKAWVDYPFMIGGWCFTIGNYLCYYQTINKYHGHAGWCQARYLCPSSLQEFKESPGTLAALLNIFGALFFNVNTMEMFFPWVKTQHGLSSWNFWYVFIGCAGSAFFVVAGFIQGEYNKWRRCECSAEVVISHMNFWGGVLFFVGYAVDWNKYADQHENITIWGVATPFTVGSIFFLLAAEAELVMWKSERYGLGFATSLTSRRSELEEQIINNWGLATSQQKLEEQMVNNCAVFFLGIYFINILMGWIRFGFVVSTDRYQDVKALMVLHTIMIYHVFLFIISSYHKIPREHPYDIIIYLIRIVAVFALVGETLDVRILISDYTLAGESIAIFSAHKGPDAWNCMGNHSHVIV